MSSAIIQTATIVLNSTQVNNLNTTYQSILSADTYTYIIGFLVSSTISTPFETSSQKLEFAHVSGATINPFMITYLDVSSSSNSMVSNGWNVGSVGFPEIKVGSDFPNTGGAGSTITIKVFYL